MIMNLIMLVTMYPTILIIFFVFKYVGKSNRRYVFGVTLEKDQKDLEEVKKITKSYDKQMWWWLLGTCWIPFLAFLTNYVSIQFTIWMMWFLGAIVVMEIPYVVANKKVMKIKGAGNEEEEPITYYELGEVRTISWNTFLGPVLLSIIPTMVLFFAKKIIKLDYLMESQLGVYQVITVTFALTTLLFVGIAYWMDRRRTMVISGNSTLNMNYARAKKQIWKKVWSELSWINGILIVIIVSSFLLNWHTFLVFMIAVVLETFLTLFIVAKSSVQQMKIDETYGKNFSLKQKSDNDRFWKWGLFYYNKADKQTMVEKRYGVGTSVNMASKWGKVCMVFLVVCLAWIPFMCVYMIVEDFTPLQVTLEENAVICKHMKVDYRIEMDEIEEVELMSELPEKRWKSSGTNSDTLEKGNFSEHSFGHFQEFVNPQNEAFIYIETGDKKYFISADTDEKTKEVYEEICKKSY